MRFDRIMVDHLGLFADGQTLELTTSSPPGEAGMGPPRKLTLIRGHNGSGKSTLFQACALALYGERAVREYGIGRPYREFLRHFLHSGPAGRANAGEVRLHVTIVRQGEPIGLEVRRRFELHGRVVDETLTLLVNGKPPELDPTLYENWLLEMIPLHLFRLCFFDAEQLETLASPDRYHHLLRTLLDPLVGIERVEQLLQDLRYYIRKATRGEDAIRLQQERDACQGEVNRLEAQLEQLLREQEALTGEWGAKAEAVREQEQRLMEAGGAYVTRLPWVRQRLKQLEYEKKEIAAEMDFWADGQLPFLLDPDRALQMQRQLLIEEQAEQEQQRVMAQRDVLACLEAEIQRAEWWLSFPFALAPEAQEDLARYLLRTVRSVYPPGEGQSPTMSTSDRRRMLEMIDQVLRAKERIEPLKQRLEDARAEERVLRAELKLVPEKGALEELQAELQVLQRDQALLERRRTALSKQCGSLEFARNGKLVHLRRLDERLDNAHAKETRLALAQKCQKALQRYAGEARAAHVAHLERAIVFCFNALCRKEHLLDSVSISAEDYRISLLAVNGQPISLSSFSAGERQLYALALLWALRLISRRQLPLLIDTPLARLDQEHRTRLATYLTNVSDQVILFVTDAEADDQFLKKVAPTLSHLYRFAFDAACGETRVSSEGEPGFSLRSMPSRS